MEELALIAAAFAAFALAAHLVTVHNAAWRLRTPRTAERAHEPGEHGPGVTIIRPVCGLDPHEEETLRSTFALAYRSYEILFCCSNRTDPVVPLVERLIAGHPHISARLLIGNDPISPNPKLNNMVKGWRAAAHDWIVMADSNVLMPPDFIARLLAAWRHDTGLVSAPPIGCRPGTVWAELECALLNAYQARWQYAGDSLGLGFAQGKVMLWRRSDLGRAGGIEALAAEPAEDAAATKVVRGLGRHVRLVDGAFAQPLGPRTAMQVWRRQVRWARLRRATFPGYFALEPFSGLLAPLLSGALAAEALEWDGRAVAGFMAATWLAAEAWLTAALGWHLSWRSPLLWVLRELALPAVWLQACFGSNLSWRGGEVSLEDGDVGLGAAGGRP
jgi:ceramide glucosyltransferase